MWCGPPPRPSKLVVPHDHLHRALRLGSFALLPAAPPAQVAAARKTMRAGLQPDRNLIATRSQAGRNWRSPLRVTALLFSRPREIQTATASRSDVIGGERIEMRTRGVALSPQSLRPCPLDPVPRSRPVVRVAHAPRCHRRRVGAHATRIRSHRGKHVLALLCPVRRCGSTGSARLSSTTCPAFSLQSVGGAEKRA